MRTQRNLGKLCVALLLASAAYGRNRIGDIEFFGYTDFAKPSQLRKELPVQVGDAITRQTIQRIREAIMGATGRAPTDVALICCDAHGNSTVFIGLPGPTTASLPYYPAPKGNVRLPGSAQSLYDRWMQAFVAAVKKGGTAAQEDDSRGYALTDDPATRALELQMRKYALRHENELLGVLKDSSSSEQRAAAAEMLGYGRQSPRQITALVRATRDPDDGVRNNATRALGVLASSSLRAAAEIPAGNFIEMMKSGIWTDRNKASLVLWQLTKSRNPALLAQLRAQALPPLVEMAKWHDEGHAFPARIILGRVAGIPEEQLTREALQPSPQAILAAIAAHRQLRGTNRQR
jgi:hypothetical protein